MSKLDLEEIDLEEIELCLNECQLKTEKDKEEIKQCVSKKLLRKFFLHTISGNIIVLVIIYLLIRRFFSSNRINE
jgi:hypothetical protein